MNIVKEINSALKYPVLQTLEIPWRYRLGKNDTEYNAEQHEYSLNNNLLRSDVDNIISETPIYIIADYPSPEILWIDTAEIRDFGNDGKPKEIVVHPNHSIRTVRFVMNGKPIHYFDSKPDEDIVSFYCEKNSNDVTVHVRKNPLTL